MQTFTLLPPIIEEMPLVSIIIPTFNCRRWIGDALDSLLNQTYSNLDIVVVDDGSTDGTKEFLQQNYPGTLTYIYQPNGGAPKARNAGLKVAKGELISFLDADDWILPEKIAHQVAYLRQHPECGLVYCNFWCAYDNDSANLKLPEACGYQNQSVSSEILASLIRGDDFPIHAPLIRKEAVELIGGFIENLHSLDDLDFWVRLAGTGIRFGYLDERMVIYRLRSGSITHDSHNLRLYRYRAYAHAREVLEPGQLASALQKIDIAATFEFGLARAYFEKKRYRDGLYHVGIALHTHRRRRLPYILFCLTYITLLPLLGYQRLERLISTLIELLPRKFTI